MKLTAAITLSVVLLGVAIAQDTNQMPEVPSDGPMSPSGKVIRMNPEEQTPGAESRGGIESMLSGLMDSYGGGGGGGGGKGKGGKGGKGGKKGGGSAPAYYPPQPYIVPIYSPPPQYGGGYQQQSYGQPSYGGAQSYGGYSGGSSYGGGYGGAPSYGGGGYGGAPTPGLGR